MFLLINIIVFLAAFLLFFIELIIAKAILPIFGGSYLVWSTCVLFFQGVLFLGYLYAYQISKKLLFRKFWIHLLLMALPLLMFPLYVSDFHPVRPGLPFSLHILILLSMTIGPAFFVLTGVSIYVQNWVAQSDLKQRKNPYMLYATSNLGAFIAILGYPFLFEKALTLSSQLWIWQMGYGILFLLNFTLLRTKAPKIPDVNSTHKDHSLSMYEKFRWILLSASAAAMFLSVTNIITFDLASVPLLWILPLSLYLLTFILTFRQSSWFPQFIRTRFGLAVIIGLFLFLLMTQSYKLPLLFSLPLHLIILFIICINAHGKLYSLKPENAQNLSTYYICIALGGFLGSLLVSYIAPLVSHTLVEYVIALGIAFWAMSEKPKTFKINIVQLILLMVFASVILLWPVTTGRLGSEYSSLLAIAFGLSACLLLFFLYKKLWSFLAAILLVMIITSWAPSADMLHQHRNFYGTYAIYDKDNKRFLRHGTTLHGSQFISGPKQNHPLTYYHFSTPVGEILSWQQRFQKIAIVGLGAGSLAAYGTPDQQIDFYELDPDIVTFAEHYFTFLRDCRSPYQMIIGDARLSLMDVQKDSYSILIIDAFNSDAIPVHLLTVEAMRLYESCIVETGLILFHVSNKYLDLSPVFKANCSALGSFVFYKNNLANLHPDAQACEWITITRDASWAWLLENKFGWENLETKSLKDIQPWTDQYSNIISVIK